MVCLLLTPVQQPPFKAMNPFLSLRRLGRLWLTALLFTLPTAALQMPSHAATLGTETINFQSFTNDGTCSFSTPTQGQLALITTDQKTISTEIEGGSKSTIVYTANFTGAEMIVDTPILTLNTEAVSTVSTTLFLSRNGDTSTQSSTEGSVKLANDLPFTDTLNIGISFTSANDEPFGPGTYDATVVLTCTDNGSK